MAKLQPKKASQKKDNINKNFLSIIFGKDSLAKELTTEDEEKITVFEKGLGSTINKSDTIEQAIEKIVKTALACEFGPSFVSQKNAGKMIKTISYGIGSDPQLRKQALIIMDRFASSKTSKYISPLTRKIN